MKRHVRNARGLAGITAALIFVVGSIAVSTVRERFTSWDGA